MQTCPTPNRMASRCSRAVVLCFSLVSAIAPTIVLAQTDAPQDEPTFKKDEVVQMDAFNVSTTIGTYHEETSSMATKVPTNLKDLASSLQILNASAINDRNALSMPDVFAYVVGATQSQSAVNGFSFRGFPNTGTFTQNIETDGLIGATLKKGASSAANVESLEFLKGPNGVLYGQMHPGGLLNIVTKDPKEVTDGSIRTSFSTYAGANNFFHETLYSGVLDVTGPLTNHLLYRFVVDAGSAPLSRKGDTDKYISMYPSLTYKWSQETYFTVKMEASQDRRRQDDGLVPIFTNGTAYGPTAYWYTAPRYTVYNDHNDIGRDRGDSVSTAFHTVIDDWTIRVQTRSVWHTDLTREFTVNNAGIYTPKATFATPTTTLTRQYNDVINGHRYNFFDANAFHQFGHGDFTNTVIVGVGGGLEFSNNSRFGFGPNVGPAVALINPQLDQSAYPADGTAIQSQRNTLTNMGEYINDQIKLWDRIHISLGVRNDQQIAHGIDVFVPTKTPYAHQNVKSVTGQAGLTFDITKQLSGYGSWSQSVVPNSVTSIDAQGNSSFGPEKGLQYETGLKFENLSRTFYVALAAYYINRSNVLVATGTVQPVSQQAIFRLDGEQHSEGYELEAQWQPKSYWQLQGGLAVGKAFIAASVKNPQTIGLDLANAPRESGNLWSRFNVPSGTLKGLGLGTGLIYVGKSWAGDPTTTLYYTLPGWVRVDGALYYKWKRYNVSLNVNNLTDRRYISSAQSAITLNPGEMRKLTLSITTHF